MPIQTLYVRSSNSAVVTGTLSVELLSTTAGTVANPIQNVKNGKLIQVTQFIPTVIGNVSSKSTSSVPTSQGWIFDGSAAGSYAAGNWVITVADLNSSATGTQSMQGQLWVVTATTTAVTSVNAFTGVLSSASFTPATTITTQTLTFSAPQITLTANQYIYLELYLNQTVAAATTAAANSLNYDSPTAGQQTFITTPNFATPSNTSSAPSNFFLLGLWR